MDCETLNIENNSLLWQSAPSSQWSFSPALLLDCISLSAWLYLSFVVPELFLYVKIISNLTCWKKWPPVVFRIGNVPYFDREMRVFRSRSGVFRFIHNKKTAQSGNKPSLIEPFSSHTFISIIRKNNFLQYSPYLAANRPSSTGSMVCFSSSVYTSTS